MSMSRARYLSPSKSRVDPWSTQVNEGGVDPSNRNFHSARPRPGPFTPSKHTQGKFLLLGLDRRKFPRYSLNAQGYPPIEGEDLSGQILLLSDPKFPLFVSQSYRATGMDVALVANQTVTQNKGVRSLGKCDPSFSSKRRKVTGRGTVRT